MPGSTTKHYFIYSQKQYLHLRINLQAWALSVGPRYNGILDFLFFPLYTMEKKNDVGPSKKWNAYSCRHFGFWNALREFLHSIITWPPSTLEFSTQCFSGIWWFMRWVLKAQKVWLFFSKKNKGKNGRTNCFVYLKFR